MIIGVSGPNGAGKGELVAYLSERSFYVHSLSDVIREELARRGESESRERMIELGRELRARGGPGALAETLGERLLPAFETPTGIPYGSVNLRFGVDERESNVTAAATAGTLIVEFWTLSQLTGDDRFSRAAKAAVRGLWRQRSALNLVGAHINVQTGEWTQKDSGIGGLIDSFYE